MLYQRFYDEHDREKLKARFYGFLLIKASRASCFCKVVTLITIARVAIYVAEYQSAADGNLYKNIRNSRYE
jgi:hypothetical protein